MKLPWVIEYSSIEPHPNGRVRWNRSEACEITNLSASQWGRATLKAALRSWRAWLRETTIDDRSSGAYRLRNLETGQIVVLNA